MKLALALLACLAACERKTVDLGIDAPTLDGPAVAPDASPCRCRITPCRVPGDCAAIAGSTCGPDFYCVRDFGPCTTDLQCQATVTDSVCTKGSDSTASCQ